MQDFTFDWKTKIIFGKKSEEKVFDEIKKYSKILVHYGSDRIVRSGLYGKIIKSLGNGFDIIELPGVKPNARLSLVREGIEICQKNKADFILAIGGGSVIDSAKAIAMGAYYSGDVWDLMEGADGLGRVIPLGAVVTLSGAGSETSQYTVITNEEKKLKKGFGSDRIRPRFAILNPELTYTVPPYHTACGIVDILSHMLERYFGQVDHPDINDIFIETSCKAVMDNALILNRDSKNYVARSEVMWISTIAQNDFMGLGRKSDFEMHKIEHELSAFYDISHGAGLAVVMPAWMEYVFSNDKKRFNKLFASVLEGYGPQEGNILEGIEELKNFFKKINMPVSLSEMDITDEKFEEIAGRCTDSGKIGKTMSLGHQDIINILNLAR